MTDTDRRARDRGREGEVVPGRQAGERCGTDRTRTETGWAALGRMPDEVWAALAARGILVHRDPATAATYARPPDEAIRAWVRQAAPGAEVVLRRAGSDGEAHAVPGGGPDDFDRVPDLDAVARFVAAVAADEDVRRWCVIALATADPSPTRQRIYDPATGILAHLPALPSGTRAALGPGRRLDGLREVPLPPSAVAEIAAWRDDTRPGLTSARLRRRLECLQAAAEPRFRVVAKALRPFVVGALHRMSPGLDRATLRVWLGLRDPRRHHHLTTFRPDLSAVTRASDQLLRDVDRRSGCALLRASRPGADGAG